MQAVVLAAGLGRRLGALTREDTKAMVAVNGRRLIDATLDAIVDAGCEGATLVIGHGGDRLLAHVGDSWRDMPVRYIRNEHYEATNNIYSLLLARDVLESDATLLLESDVLFDSALLRDLVADPRPDVAVVDVFREWMDGTTVEITEYGGVARFHSGSAPAPRRPRFKTVNIYKFSQAFSRAHLVPHLTKHVAQSGAGGFYEEVLAALTDDDHAHLGAHIVAGHRWAEVDDGADLADATTLFGAPDAGPAAYLGRHGGYWRFPALVDFSLPTSVAFPPPELTARMQRAFPDLLSAYPSTQWVQRGLAARMIGIEPDRVLVGNGSAELIAALGAVLGSRRVGMFTPSFEEYAARLGAASIETVATLPDPSVRSVGSAIDLGRRNEALLLVNPDNPTGACFRREELLEIAEGMSGTDSLLIVDESFVDFSDESAEATLLDDEVLSRFPGLVVIKSLGKSYGVPGLRLGILATADSALMSSITGQQPVWNVNSMAEFLLQVLPRYAPDYRASCLQVRQEREWLTEALAALGWIEVSPSQANFLLCRVDGRTGADVARELLRSGLLVRDLTGKPGVPGDSYLRFSVRGRADNGRLVDALRAMG